MDELRHKRLKHLSEVTSQRSDLGTPVRLLAAFPLNGLHFPSFILQLVVTATNYSHENCTNQGEFREESSRRKVMDLDENTAFHFFSLEGTCHSSDLAVFSHLSLVSKVTRSSSSCMGRVVSSVL